MLAGQSGPEISLTQLDNEFRQYAQNKGYLALQFGRLTVRGKEQVWARYYLGDGVWHKKYSKFAWLAPDLPSPLPASTRKCFYKGSKSGMRLSAPCMFSRRMILLCPAFSIFFLNLLA